MAGIEAIILDLGGVIIGVDYDKTSKTFKKLGAKNFDDIYSQCKQSELFDLFETGKISASEFRKKLKNMLGIDHVTDTEFDDAWNAMLLPFPSKILSIISLLKETYKVFLFSNTNEIHIKRVFEIFYSQFGKSNFDGLFNKEYYSHQFQYRKPHKEAFEKILHENNLAPETTLFVDDTEGHPLEGTH